MGNLPVSDKRKCITRSDNQYNRHFTLNSQNIANDLENEGNEEMMDDQKLEELLNHYTICPTENWGENDKLPILFQWPYGGKSVYVSGSFNDWKEKIKLKQISTDSFQRMKIKNPNSQMSHRPNTYYGIIHLPVGTYTYKFIVDDKWIHDKQKPVVINSFGTPENVIEVKESDFNVLEALRNDESRAVKRKTLLDQSFREWTKYSNDIPDYENDLNFSQSLAPSIPPYLEQKVIIDNDREIDNPNLLPTNHVIFNHLLTHSVKDNVIMVSLINRFRDKVVTTVFYKPVD